MSEYRKAKAFGHVAYWFDGWDSAPLAVPCIERNGNSKWEVHLLRADQKEYGADTSEVVVRHFLANIVYETVQALEAVGWALVEEPPKRCPTCDQVVGD